MKNNQGYTQQGDEDIDIKSNSVGSEREKYISEEQKMPDIQHMYAIDNITINKGKMYTRYTYDIE